MAPEIAAGIPMAFSLGPMHGFGPCLVTCMRPSRRIASRAAATYRHMRQYTAADLTIT